MPCSNAANTRSPLKFSGYRELANRSQPLVGRSSPYYENMWTGYCCLTSFSRLSIHALVATAPQICAMVAKWRVLRPVFSASRVQHISDMYSKFALNGRTAQEGRSESPCRIWSKSAKPINQSKFIFQVITENNNVTNAVALEGLPKKHYAH